MRNTNDCCRDNDRCNNPCSTIETIENDLCDMKAILAETRANLFNLARIMCMLNGCISDEEKELLLSIEGGINHLDCKVADTRANIDFLDNELC